MKQSNRKPKATVKGRQAKAKRRGVRRSRETPREQRRRAEALVAKTGDGSERMEQMMANAPKVKAKRPRPRIEWSVRDCNCDPPRDHGPHYRKSIVREEVAA